MAGFNASNTSVVDHGGYNAGNGTLTVATVLAQWGSPHPASIPSVILSLIGALMCLCIAIALLRDRRFRLWPNVIFVAIMIVAAIMSFVMAWYAFVSMDRAQLMQVLTDTNGAVQRCSGNALCMTQAFFLMLTLHSLCWMHVLLTVQLFKIIVWRKKPTLDDAYSGIVLVCVLSITLAVFGSAFGDVHPYANACRPISPSWIRFINAISILSASAISGILCLRCFLYVKGIVEKVPIKQAVGFRLSAEAVHRVKSLMRKVYILSAYFCATTVILSMLVVYQLGTSVRDDAADDQLLAEIAAGMPESSHIRVRASDVLELFYVYSLAILYCLIFTDTVFPHCGEEEVWIARVADLDSKKFRGQMELIGRVSEYHGPISRPWLRSAFWRHASYFSLAHTVQSIDRSLRSLMQRGAEGGSFASRRQFVTIGGVDQDSRMFPESKVTQGGQRRSDARNASDEQSRYVIVAAPQSLATVRYKVNPDDSEDGSEAGSMDHLASPGLAAAGVRRASMLSPETRTRRGSLHSSIGGMISPNGEVNAPVPSQGPGRKGGSTTGTSGTRGSSTNNTGSAKDTSSNPSMWSRLWKARPSVRSVGSNGSAGAMSTLHRVLPMFMVNAKAAAKPTTDEHGRHTRKASMSQGAMPLRSLRTGSERTATGEHRLSGEQTSGAAAKLDAEVAGIVRGTATSTRLRRQSLDEINERYRNNLTQDGLIDVALQAAKEVMRRRSVNDWVPEARRSGRRRSKRRASAAYDPDAARRWLEQVDVPEPDHTAYDMRVIPSGPPITVTADDESNSPPVPLNHATRPRVARFSRSAPVNEHPGSLSPTSRVSRNSTINGDGASPERLVTPDTTSSAESTRIMTNASINASQAASEATDSGTESSDLWRGSRHRVRIGVTSGPSSMEPVAELPGQIIELPISTASKVVPGRHAVPHRGDGLAPLRHQSLTSINDASEAAALLAAATQLTSPQLPGRRRHSAATTSSHLFSFKSGTDPGDLSSRNGAGKLPPPIVASIQFSNRSLPAAVASGSSEAVSIDIHSVVRTAPALSALPENGETGMGETASTAEV